MTFYISDFKTIRPRYSANQDATLQWLTHAHEQSARNAAGGTESNSNSKSNISRRIHHYACSSRYIESRGFEIDDATHENWDEMKIFSFKEGPEGSSLGKRMEFFQKRVREVFSDLYQTDLYPLHTPPPRELLHVSCTGYVSPSPAQELVEKMGWGANSRVTHLYHMGCYASFPALRTACAYLCLPEALANANMDSSQFVDVVHTELCTLHMNPSLNDPEQLVVQTLFADGHIKYSIFKSEGNTAGQHSEATLPNIPCLEILALKEKIIPNTQNDMTWTIGEKNFKMSLSRSVPEKISFEALKFLERLAETIGFRFNDLREEAVFAIHPGGPRIIDQVQTLLGVRENQIAHSRETLRKYGNMSSATLPHIWKNIVEDSNCPSGKLIFSLAFGPGLTISGGLFKKVATRNSGR